MTENMPTSTTSSALGTAGGVPWKEILRAVQQKSGSAAYHLLLLYVQGNVDASGSETHEGVGQTLPTAGVHLLQSTLETVGLGQEEATAITHQCQAWVPDDQAFLGLVRDAHTQISSVHNITEVLSVDCLVSLLSAGAFDSKQPAASSHSQAKSDTDPTAVAQRVVLDGQTVWQLTDTQMAKVLGMLVKELLQRNTPHAAHAADHHSLQLQLQRAATEAKRWKLLLKRSLLDHAETKEHLTKDMSAKEQQHQEELFHLVSRLVVNGAVRAVVARAEGQQLGDELQEQLSEARQLLSERDATIQHMYQQMGQMAWNSATARQGQDHEELSRLQREVELEQLQRVRAQREREQEQLLLSRLQREHEQEQLQHSRLQQQWERERLECSRQQRLRMQLDLEHASRLQVEMEHQFRDLRCQLEHTQQQLLAAEDGRAELEQQLAVALAAAATTDIMAKDAIRTPDSTRGQVNLTITTAFATAHDAATAALDGDEQPPEIMLGLPPQVIGHVLGTGHLASPKTVSRTVAPPLELRTPNTYTNPSDSDARSHTTADTPEAVVVSSPSVGNDNSPPAACIRPPLPSTTRSRANSSYQFQRTSTTPQARGFAGVSFTRLPSRGLARTATDPTSASMSVGYRAVGRESTPALSRASGLAYAPLAVTRSVPAALDAISAKLTVSVEAAHCTAGGSTLSVSNLPADILVRTAADPGAELVPTTRDTEPCRDNRHGSLGHSPDSVPTIYEDSPEHHILAPGTGPGTDSCMGGKSMASSPMASGSKTVPINKLDYLRMAAAPMPAATRSFNGRHTMSPTLHARSSLDGGQSAPLGLRSRAGYGVPRKMDFSQDHPSQQVQPSYSTPLPKLGQGPAGRSLTSTNSKSRSFWSKRADWELALLPDYTELRAVTSIAETDEASRSPQKKKSLSRRVRSSWDKFVRKLAKVVVGSSRSSTKPDPKVVARAVWLTTNTTASLPY